jgi:predicted CoA-substrate-specific enzyme activase
MGLQRNILGIDIGSVSLGMVEITPEGEIVNTSYQPHRGKIADAVSSALEGMSLSEIAHIAATCSTPYFIKASKRYDNNVCLITSVQRLHGSARGLLNIGGERFCLLIFDEHNNYLKCRTNTSCAAGTGSFLDQQALRLNLPGSKELGVLAAANKGSFPVIASRCAVFAKTDLIHAQQDGYSLPEICDGLSYGMAKNIVDTLFTGEKVNGPIAVCGGVSKNPAVLRHIRKLIGEETLIVDEVSSLYGALGAAIRLTQEEPGEIMEISSPRDLILQDKPVREYPHEPLDLKLSHYPDFSGTMQYAYHVRTRSVPEKVEVDIYREPAGNAVTGIYLGIDVGSTSTKAAIMDRQKNILAGFYTWTAGRPVDAVCALFEAIDDFTARSGCVFDVIGSGTTGSGRKLIAGIINADIAVDEISAHARSAYELNPQVDTIIEIGGQDSKFTTIRNSRVTFCAMNTVCAAGTGSFIEEQARRMDCPLKEYAKRTEGIPSPMSSDRCTVFMERDMNYYLGEGYSPDELLASALHSIRENYLTKVAIQSGIGDVICFQGATAKNKALVAAFEQRLGRPIHVSRYCHLTGALGVALMLLDGQVQSGRFRGFDLYARQIPIRSEICRLCTNYCKLTVADLEGEELAYGFLCGRDYHTKKQVSNNTSGFDLPGARSKAFSFSRQKNFRYHVTIGIPDALHLRKDREFWQHFFNSLSIRTVTGSYGGNPVEEGKKFSGAEFCAPLKALSTQVGYLLQKANYVFLPFYLEDKQKTRDIRRQYCYYTQYSPSLVAISFPQESKRILKPLVRYLYSSFHTKKQLHRMFRQIPGLDISFKDVSSAYDAALEFKHNAQKELLADFRREASTASGISVVLLGRPYNVFSPTMNKGIIDMFASRGIKVFSHDMLPLQDHEPGFELKILLDEIPWRHAADILHAADLTAATDGLYPVLVTSFRCSPDSFIVEYFKRLMDSYHKPYLILQLDEHDSNIGYETRIEAAIRSFQNHVQERRPSGYTARFQNIAPVHSYAGKTLIFPNWDNLSCRFIVSVMRQEGIDAALMEEDETSLLKSLKYNTGQCIPINIMAQEYIDTMARLDLDPGRCVLWIGRGEIACNLKMIPHHIKNILNSHGNGVERAEVYHGDISMMDVSPRATVNGYLAFMFGGLIRRLGCRIRPYELEKGMTDRTIEEGMNILEGAFQGKRSKVDALEEVIAKFGSIPILRKQRPKIAIIGDLYVRDNDFSNQGLIRFIEEHGGEVITTPYSSYIKMIAQPYFRKWAVEGKYLYSVSTRAYLATLKRLEKRYYQIFESLLQEPDHEYLDPAGEILADFHVLLEHTGESMDNILKTYYLKKYHPDVSLFVQASPAFCCPALVTEAMAGRIEEITGIPVVNITYDGTCSDKNRVIIPYLTFPKVNTAGRRHAADIFQECPVR